MYELENLRNEAKLIRNEKNIAYDDLNKLKTNIKMNNGLNIIVPNTTKPG